MDASAAAQPLDETEMVKVVLRTHREAVMQDAELLAELGLRLDAANIVDFGPVALSRVAAAHERESSQRKRLEAISAANFAAQARTHASVIELLEASDRSDLASRVDEIARTRFDLVAGVVALEGPRGVPAGWRALAEGQVDLILGRRRHARMGIAPTALGLFGDLAPVVGSVAMVRLAVADRAGVIAFGGGEICAFSADMGSELVSFLARVVERTACRWPWD
ncbi:MAG TPA: DUF484 family protein [Caulobacteraceae bacterium]|jgi:hypothetical protein|nr:DUF484 family protein [Caulobacteraceae bacterium]